MVNVTSYRSSPVPVFSYNSFCRLWDLTNCRIYETLSSKLVKNVFLRPVENPSQQTAVPIIFDVLQETVPIKNVVCSAVYCIRNRPLGG